MNTINRALCTLTLACAGIGAGVAVHRESVERQKDEDRIVELEKQKAIIMKKMRRVLVQTDPDFAAATTEDQRTTLGRSLVEVLENDVKNCPNIKILFLKDRILIQLGKDGDVLPEITGETHNMLCSIASEITGRGVRTSSINDEEGSITIYLSDLEANANNHRGRNALFI